MRVRHSFHQLRCRDGERDDRFGLAQFATSPASDTAPSQPAQEADVLAWSVWLGLVAGLLEVASRVLFRAVDPTGRLYLMTRHFVWLTPLVNALLFTGIGLLLAGFARYWPRLAGWLSVRLLFALALQPALLRLHRRFIRRRGFWSRWASRHTWLGGSSRSPRVGEGVYGSAACLFYWVLSRYWRAGCSAATG